MKKILSTKWKYVILIIYGSACVLSLLHWVLKLITICQNIYPVIQQQKVDKYYQG